MDILLDSNISQDREKLRRLFRVKQTELELLRIRDFNIKKCDILSIQNRDFTLIPLNIEKFLDFTFDDFLSFREEHKLFKSRLEFSAKYVHSITNENIMILYLYSEGNKKVNKSDTEIVYIFVKKGYKHLLLITENGLGNPSINTSILSSNIEIFLDEDLAFNRTKHAYAPIHVDHITASNVNEWSEKEQLNANKLPIILTDDIISKYYGGKPMDIFQYELMSPSSDRMIYYRNVRTMTGKK